MEGGRKQFRVQWEASELAAGESEYEWRPEKSLTQAREVMTNGAGYAHTTSLNGLRIP